MARKVLNGLDLQNQRLTGLASASVATDAVNLAQLQAAINGLSWHGAVRAASTTNINLASPGTTIDGVTMAVGNRFLAKDQTAAVEKGAYIWNGAATPASRAVDGTQGNLNAGAAFYVDEGTVNADTSWTLTTDDPITIGTTALAFAKFSGGGTAYVQGSGISISGATIAIDTSVVARKIAGNVGDGSSTSIGFAHNLSSLDVQVQLYEVSSGATVDCDVTRTNGNTVTLVFAVAPSASQFRVSVQG